jgi:hypothetical protein
MRDDSNAAALTLLGVFTMLCVGGLALAYTPQEHWWAVIAGAAWSSFAVLGGYISCQTGRPVAEGITLGLLFGPVGAIVAALLPGTVRTAAPRDETPDLPATQIATELKPEPAKRRSEDGAVRRAVRPSKP